MATGSAQLLTVTELLGVTNGVAQTYSVLQSQLATAYGWGTTTLGRVVGQSGTSYGVCDKYKHSDLDAGAQYFADALNGSTFWQSAAGNLFAGIDSNCAIYGRHVSTSITEADSFCTYYNTATAFQSCVHLFAALCYWQYKGRAAMLTNTNVLCTSVNLGSGTVTDATTVGFDDGAAVNQVSTVASGIQGCCADNIYLQGLTGTFSGTVWATGITNALATHVWTAECDGVGGGTAAFTPATAGERAFDILGISYDGDGGTATFDIRTISRNLTA